MATQEFTYTEKTKTTPSAVKDMASIFWDFQSVLFIDFLTEQ
jgi:hypothetical protein